MKKLIVALGLLALSSCHQTPIEREKEVKKYYPKSVFRSIPEGGDFLIDTSVQPNKVYIVRYDNNYDVSNFILIN